MRPLFILAALLASCVVRADELDTALATIQSAKVDASNSAKVAKAWRVAASAGIDDVPRILTAMPEDNLLVQNWIRNAADSVLETTLNDGEELPTEMLRDYTIDRSHPPRARRVAYEWLQKVDPLAASQLLTEFLDDPNLELRYDAVAQLITAADEVGDDAQRTTLLKKAFQSARDFDQLSTCATTLEQSGVEVSIVEQLGFITAWSVVGPFDNMDDKGFDTAFPPELTVDIAATHEGKNDQVSWSRLDSNAPMGMVDVAEEYENEKGAVAYLTATIESQAEVDANLRYLTQNATKLWINGELVAVNHVYHAGGEGDQYIVPVKLKNGENQILLKLCQNEQTEPWAQTWEFALRVCDPLGGKLDGVSIKR